MAHLKHCGPVRAARTAKRTALVEIQGGELAANDALTAEQRALADVWPDVFPLVSKTVRDIDAEVADEMREQFYRAADAGRESRKFDIPESTLRMEEAMQRARNGRDA